MICPLIVLTYLPHWKAYAVRRDGNLVGLVRCAMPLPFRAPVELS